MEKTVKLELTSHELDFLVGLMMTQGQSHADFLVMNDLADSKPEGRITLTSGAELRIRLIRSVEFATRLEQYLCEQLVDMPKLGAFMDNDYDYLDYVDLR